MMMDSIVDYLIVLFFIISFLSSVFKKKKKQMAKADQAQLRPVVEVKKQYMPKKNVVAQKNTSVAKPSFENMLKAMLQVPEPVEEQKSEVDAYFEEAMKKSTMMTTKKKSLISASEKHLQKIVKNKKPSSYDKAIREINKKHSNQESLRIKENLHNAATLKNYIVMNEILGKPIALRE